jgi:hypothetical protein
MEMQIASTHRGGSPLVAALGRPEWKSDSNCTCVAVFVAQWRGNEQPKQEKPERPVRLSCDRGA